MDSKVTIGDLNAVIDDTPFLADYGVRVESCASGECALLVPFNRSMERPGGIISGMAIMGAADVAMWLAVMTLRGLDEQWVTADIKTAFLRSGREDDFVCKAVVLKLGRRIAYGTAESRARSTNELLAHHTVTYMKAAG